MGEEQIDDKITNNFPSSFSPNKIMSSPPSEGLGEEKILKYENNTKNIWPASHFNNEQLHERF